MLSKNSQTTNNIVNFQNERASKVANKIKK
jgi:hypothetical protein